MPARRRPPKHVREATRAARANGEELPLVKPDEAKTHKTKPQTKDQLSDKIAKAQIQAELNVAGLANEIQNPSKPMLNLGMSPDVLMGRWSDAAGNNVNVYPGDNYSMSFWVTLSRPCGPDINLTLRPSPNGRGWYCGSAQLDETRSTLTQLFWVFPNGTISIWRRDLTSNDHFNHIYGGSHYMNYSLPQDFMLEEGAVPYADEFCESSWGQPAPGEWHNMEEDYKGFSPYTAQAAVDFQNLFSHRTNPPPDEPQQTSRMGAGANTLAENGNTVIDETGEGAARLPEPSVDDLHQGGEAGQEQSCSTQHPLETPQLDEHSGAQHEANADAQNDQERWQETTAEEFMQGIPEASADTEESSSQSMQDNLFVVPHVLTPIHDFHNSLITAPMCYVVMSKARPKPLASPMPDPSSGARSSTDDAGISSQQVLQSVADPGDGEQYYDYSKGYDGDYADSLFGGVSSCGGEEDDYDCCDDYGIAVDVESKASKDSKASRDESKDDLSSETSKPRSAVSASARSCPW